MTIRTDDGKPDGSVEIAAGGEPVLDRRRPGPMDADGKSVLIVNRDDKGRFGIQAYPFAAGTRPAAGSWLLPGLDSSDAIETFGISPDGKKIVVASVATSNSLMTAANVPGVKRPAATR